MTRPTAFVISHEPDRTRRQTNKAISIIALTLTRALGRENVNVVRVHPNLLDYSLASKYCSAIEICPDMYESEVSLVQFLRSLSSRYAGQKVLIPASDDCSIFLAKYEHELSEDFILLNPSALTMKSVKNKRLQYELANASDVPIPETYFPENQEEVDCLSRTLSDFPYIIKPLEAQKWRLTNYADVSNGQKAITVHNAQELRDEYARIAAFDANVMIQEIIPGPDENLLTFLGYCSKDHKPFAYCVRSKLRQSPLDFGYCTATVSCHNAMVEEYSKRLLREANYCGIVGIEFKYDFRTDSYKLIEINTRPVNTTGLSISCGVNLPLVAYRDVIGQQQEPITDWEDGVTWIRLHQDLTAARELRRRGQLTYIQWLKSISGKRVHAVFATDDLRPFLQYYYRYLKFQLSRVLNISPIAYFARSTRRTFSRMTAWIW